MGGNLNILLVAAEVAPFAKTGGLADVAGALPHALAKLGHDVRVLMPYYRQVAAGPWETKVLKTTVQVEGAGLPEEMPRGFQLREGVLPGSKIPVYFVDQPQYFDREKLYGDAGGDYRDNGDRFAFFALAALSACKATAFLPDVIHLNDWHTGFLSVYLRTKFRDDAYFKRCSTLFTVHNLAYQGMFPDWQFGRTGLDWNLYTAEGLEFYGQMNIMKGALLYSDKINTVSPRYAEEIKTVEFGCGLEGVLRGRAGDLSGIINGLDTQEWDPATDKHLKVHYGSDSLEKKAEVKRLLKAELGLPDDDVPLVAMVTRLDNMKGLSLVEEISDYLMHMDIQFALLGTGDPRFHESFQRLADTYPDKAAVRLKFDEGLAHRIEAGADMFLMPSRFEPCGLNQLISLRYGTVPVVRAVGGLADTVQEFDPRTGQGNGFVFSEYNSMGLFNAIKRALDLYKNQAQWRQLQRQGMEADHSWAASARKYEALYAELAALKKKD
jgi:starch synthase